MVKTATEKGSIGLDSPVKPGNDGHLSLFVIPRLDRGIQVFRIRYRIYAPVQ